MRNLLIIAATIIGFSAPALAQESERAQPQASSSWLESVTVEGGPIISRHFQSGTEHFRENHGLGIVKVATRDYGNWGLYLLTPNSVDRTSVGAGYVTDPYVVPLGSWQLELSAALGLVTGYQDYPVPMIAGEMRLVVYRNGPWDAGLAMAALPYYMEDTVTHENHVGIVGTMPFFSVRYNFN